MNKDTELMMKWITDEIAAQIEADQPEIGAQDILEAVVAKRFPHGAPEGLVEHWEPLVSRLLMRLFESERARMEKLKEEADHFQSAIEHEFAAGREPSAELREACLDIGRRLQAEGERNIQEANALREKAGRQRRLE
jgi:hypothetical protein